MTECYGNNFILNGELQPLELFTNSMVYEGESIYEVLRVIKGIPVFYSDHYSRLESSVNLQLRKMVASSSKIRQCIVKLIDSEKKKDINLKIVFNYNKEAENWIIYFIEPFYPSAEQYKKGVKGILFTAERKDPRSKVINHKLRSEIYHRLIIDGAYEALLVNRKGCVTEGSRSNVLFIKDDVIYTAPDSAVLSGITRKHIIDICIENDIPLKYMCVKADSISEYESAVMTGTSPVVLPYQLVGDVRFNVNHPYITLLRNLYLAKAGESMRDFESQLSHC